MTLHRHEALRPLSRDHHLALQLAKALQPGASPPLRAQLPAEQAELVAHVQRVYDKELKGHFDVEDRVLAPAVLGRSAELDAIIETIESEHSELEAMCAGLSEHGISASTVDARLDAFGQKLEAHVRREEREYYARVQEVLDDHALAELGVSLERHMVYHGER